LGKFCRVYGYQGVNGLNATAGCVTCGLRVGPFRPHPGIARVGGEMRFKTSWLALTASIAMTSAAAADCRIMRFTFRFSQNESVSTTGVSTGGSACTTGFRSGGTSVFRSATVAAAPAHGTLTEIGAMRFRYKPTPGFKGADRYSIRICGTGRAGSGCATLGYNITVE
jgi:hypothetical protein